jgi:RND family efflux transporter MFP subunit
MNTETGSVTASRCGSLFSGFRSGAIKKLAFSLLGIAGLVLLLLVLQGTLKGGKVAPGTLPLPGQEPKAAAPTVAVLRQEIDDVLEWPGTIRSGREVQVASKLLARIRELKVDIGSRVASGEILAVLDDRDLNARLEQSKSALASAEAQAIQSDAEYRRIKSLFEKEAATQRDLEGVQARSSAARSQVEQARHAVMESEVMLSESVLRAPIEGVMTGKWAQAGDTAIPGKPIVTLQDVHDLRLEAQVSEECARKTTLGMEVRVRIDALGRDGVARVEEIAPTADAESRTVLLKARLAAGEGPRVGMFGRLLLPCGRKTALLIPASAVFRSGQLEMVRVLEGGEAQVRHIRTGKISGDRIEVLSGLREGERILSQGK